MSADTQGETRRFPPEGGTPGRSSRGWRTEQGRHSIRAQRIARRMKIGSVLLALVAILGLIIWLLIMQPVPPSKYIAVSLSHYPVNTIPPNLFGSEDGKLLGDFFTAAAEFWNYDGDYEPETWDDRLNPEVLLRERQFPDVSKDRGNLVVFVSLHGRVSPDSGDPGTGEAQLLGSSGEPISVRSLLKRMSEDSHAENMLLLIDVGRLLPNWRMGVLANDFPTQLAEDVKQSGIKNLSVVCSCLSGEYSWPRYDDKQSSFAYFIAEGLRGAADGYASADAGDKQDRRVTSEELFAYVRDNVGKWAQDNPGVEQTVWQVFGGETGFNFPIVAVDSDFSALSADDPSAAGDPDDAPEAESTASAESSNDEDKPPTPEERLSQLDEQLVELFRRRDALWEASRTSIPVEAYAPHAWNRLQAHLVRAEQQVRGGLADQAVDTLERIEELFASIERSSRPEGAAELATLSLALARQLAPVAFATPEDAEEFDKALRDVDRALLVDEKEAAKPLGELQKTFLDDDAKSPAAKQALAAWLLDEADEDCSRERLLQLRPVMDVLGLPGELPAELALLRQLISLAESQRVEWSPEWSNLCRRALSVRTKAEQAVALQHATFPFVGEDLQHVLRQVQAGERWLLAGDPQRLAAQAFDRATRSLDGNLGQDSLIQAIRLANQLSADLPVQARFKAFQLESEALDAGRLEDLLQLGRQLRSGETSPGTAVENLGVERSLLESLRWVNDWSRGIAAYEAQPESQERALQELLRRPKDRWKLDWIFGDQRTNENWRAIEELLQLPKVHTDERLAQRGKFAPMPGVGLKITSPGSHSGRGIWHGFWAIQVLQLTAVDDETRDALNSDALWSAWETFVQDTIDDAPDLKLAHDRAHLGNLISDAWTNISKQVQDHDADDPVDVRRHLPLVRLLDGMDLPGSPDQIVQRRRDAFLRDWLLAHARHTWMPFADRHAGYEGLIDRLERGFDLRRQNRTRNFGSPARLAQLELDRPKKNSVTDFRVPITRPGGGDCRVWIIASNDVTVSRDGEEVRQPVSVPAGVEEIKFGLQARAGIPSQQLTVVLLDETDDLPLDIQTVALPAPFDKDGWGVKFVSAQQAGGGRRSDVVEPEPELFLPAFSAEPIPFNLMLVRPPNDVTAKVTVSAFGIGEDGKRKLLGEVKDFELPSGRQVPLTLAQGAAPATGDAEAAEMGRDVSGGLEFKIEPDGQEAIYFAVRPVFWRATNFVDQDSLRVTFEDGRISVDVRRRDDGVPAAEFPVELVLPNDAVGELRSLQGTLSEQQQRLTLFATIAPELQEAFTKQPLPVSLSVAGLPRAFRWEVQQGSSPFLNNKRNVRIAVLDPPGGDSTRRALLKAGDRLRVAFEIDSEIDPDRPAELQWELLPGAGGDAVSVPFRLQKNARVSRAPDGAWLFRTEAKDFEQEIPVAGKSGKFTLTARLVQGNQIQASDSIDVAIDVSPPVVRTPEFLELKDGENYPIGRLLKVRVSADDDESGIAKIAIGRETDNKPGLSDAEILATRSGPGLLELSPDQLPMEPNSVARFLVVATNGIGLQSNPVSKVIRFFKPTTPEPSTIGELEVVIHSDYLRDTYDVVLKAKDGKTQKKTISRGTASCSFKAPAGVYDLEIDGRKRDATVSGVEIVAGRRKTTGPIKPSL